MAIPDEGGASSGTYEYESFGGKVNVEVTDMVTYFQEMGFLSGEILTAATTAMGEMSMMISTGLNKPSGDAGVFAEGAMAARSMSSRLAQFQMFMTDLHEGVRNVGAGAVVIAEIYENADNENGATVNDIGFIFGDPGARGPEGFRNGNVETFADEAERTGMNAMSLSGDNSLARSFHHPFGATYMFPDGSSKDVTVTRESATSHNTSPVTLTTTTIRDANGNVISTITERTYSNHMGYNYTTQTTTTGDDRNGRTSTTNTAEAPDGDMTVTTTTSATTDGQQGPETTSTTTVERGEHREDTDRGPVETATDEMETHGTDDFVESYGEGY